MEAMSGALALLDCLQRNDLAGVQTIARTLRRERVSLRRDGLELVEHAVNLDRPLALRELLRLGSSGLPFELFGIYWRDGLTGLASACLESGRIRSLLELLLTGPVLPPLNHDDALVDRIAQAAIVEFALDDDAVRALVDACGTHRGAFLVHAMRAGRRTLLTRLAESCTSNQCYGARTLGEAPLIAAAQAGASWALAALVAAGARPSVGLRGVGYPLHFALRCEQLSSAARVELIEELLRLGAVPELRNADGLDAYALATALHDDAALRALRTHGRSYGPRQSREARAKGVRDLCLIYDKADGLIYRIGQPDIPFLAGGDYDGPCPCAAAEFRSDFEGVCKRRDLALDWFEPFLRLLEQGQEFSYKELISKAPYIRLVGFDQITNWSQMVD